MEGRCCDNCKWYEWYWDKCTKWDCEMDARSWHSCFEEHDTDQYEEQVSKLYKPIGVNIQSL